MLSMKWIRKIKKKNNKLKDRRKKAQDIKKEYIQK